MHACRVRKSACHVTNLRVKIFQWADKESQVHSFGFFYLQARAPLRIIGNSFGTWKLANRARKGQIMS